MSQKTQAAILVDTTHPLQLMELSLPQLRDGQLLVEIAYSGVCHSQLNEVRGRRGVDRFLPHTLGHEGSGTVIAIGKNVTKAKPGDKVVLSWLKGSGSDVPSTTYESPQGSINSGAISTFMRCTVTCESRITVIPEAFPLKLAALLGCAVPTGAGIVFNTSQLKANESVAVIGTGGIGLSAVMAAKAIGADPIIAVDIISHKLAKAQEMGATHLLDASATSTLEGIRGITNGKGVDVAIECSGHISAMEQAFESVRTGGGLCVIAGNPAQGQTMSINPFSLIGGKRLLGSWGGETQPDSDIPKYIDMFLRGQLALEKLVTNEYPLGDINQALDDLEAGRVVRAMVDMARG